MRRLSPRTIRYWMGIAIDRPLHLSAPQAEEGEAALHECLRLAEGHAKLLAALRAIKARLNGDFDNPDLMACGPLTTSVADIERIADTAISPAENEQAPTEPILAANHWQFLLSLVFSQPVETTEPNITAVLNNLDDALNRQLENVGITPDDNAASTTNFFCSLLGVENRENQIEQ